MESDSNKQSCKQRNDPKQRVFGVNSLQVTGGECSHLIGSVIEKGISENSQNVKPLEPPKVTVLPFPVARHRSHGPHWGRVSSKSIANGSNEDDEDEGVNDSTEFGKISAFANPVQRKLKKGLNLGQWRKPIMSDNTMEIDMTEGKRSDVKKKKTRKQNKGEQTVDSIEKKHIPFGPSGVDKTSIEVDVGQDASSSVTPCSITEKTMSTDMDIQSPSSAAQAGIYNSHPKLRAQENIGDAHSNIFKTEAGSKENVWISGLAETKLEKMENAYPASREMPSKKEQRSSNIVSNSVLKNIGNEQRSVSLENEIDAENRARLSSMSPEEIVEAQVEIMKKLDSSLINLLKKRGQEKLKQKNLQGLDEVTNSKTSDCVSEDRPIQKSNMSLHVGSHGSDTMAVNSASDSKSGPDDDLVRDNKGLGNSSLWNNWSGRVEAVRRLRFSLEGIVMADEPETGDTQIDGNSSVVNVTERDFLRSEGDPAALGYTIREAVQLTRSVIPGQRALALHLLAAVLDKAICNIQQCQVGCTIRSAKLFDKLHDWEAIWAYALGPEPELALSLRLCLDDNHNSVVLACARVIQCALSCDLTECFFDISEKIAVYDNYIFTGPLFRSKPDIDGGFLHGGFWKYNAKPSNILTFTEDIIEAETEGERTIQDDITVASQDFAAGMVRMGILPRMQYLLEGDLGAALEESIISILVAIARHSPACANAIMKCQGLVDRVVHKFTKGDITDINPSKIKSVTLLKVLSQYDKNNCVKFIKNGTFQAMTQHLFRYTSSLDQWIKSGKENCELSSALIVEQLRFWRGCINYGFSISYFSDIFPALCLWLNPPPFKKLQDNSVLSAFASISREAYLVLEALSKRLPGLYSQKQQSNRISHCGGDDDLETWSWNFVTPMVDLALKWIAARSDLHISEYIEWKKGMRSNFVFQDSSCSSLLWVVSAVMHTLSSMLERVNLAETMTTEGHGSRVPWLPEFVPRVGLEIIKNHFSITEGAEEQEDFVDGSFLEELCFLRNQSKSKSSLAAVCCLHGLFRIITSVDSLISLAKSGICHPPTPGYSFSREGKILETGILKRSLVDWKGVLNIFMKLVASEWHLVQSIEIFGRGGPAPGVGPGWGASGGGFWSISVLLAQADARFLIYMLEIVQMVSSAELPVDKEMTSAMHMINSILGACLTFGPRDRIMIEKALDILFQVPVLKYIGACIQHVLKMNKKKPFSWEYEEDDYLLFSEMLASHYKSKWLSSKKKWKATIEDSSFMNKTSKKGNVSLDTIYEDTDASNSTSLDHSCSSLTIEWAHQRLPLPMHWFLSLISAISYNKHAGIQGASNLPNLLGYSSDMVEVAKGGLFFILAMEAMSTFQSPDIFSPIRRVPLVWKVHSLSVILLVGMDVLEDNKTKDVYEALQDIYGQLLDEARFKGNPNNLLEENVNAWPDKSMVESLKFQSEIYESYSMFLDALVDQFAAVSYGDLVFGRQVSVYLHCCTEAAVRLSAWNALSNARVLEILPPLEKCIAEADGYLEPIEDNEDILEAYVKSWISGALDRSATRGSMAFHLVLHHLSSFIFLVHDHDKMSLRNKLVKALLRDCSQKPKHRAMMVELIKYSKPSTSQLPEGEGLSLQKHNAEKRFKILAEACERDSSLLAEVGNLRSTFEPINRNSSTTI